MPGDLISEFYERVEREQIDWVAKGFVFNDGRVYTISHDTKLLGRIFEILTEPILQAIADDYGYDLETPEQQNFYPDFILSPRGEYGNKIAVDVKTTYRSYTRNGLVSPFKFTLGSYASFLRDGHKNIAYTYDEYAAHYVVGFIYDRNPDIHGSEPFFMEDLEHVPSPYYNVEYFIQEKHRIAGFGTGSGNTENIGTITSRDVRDFIDGNGPFAYMGNDAFELYWRNYPRYRAAHRDFYNLPTFADWVAHNNDVDDDLRNRIIAYANSVTIEY